MKYEAFKPEYLVCDRMKLPNTVSRLWRGPWSWVVYGVEEVAEALALAARGVEYVQSMSVRSLAQALK